MNLFEWAEKNPRLPLEKDDTILINTREGDKRIPTLLRVNGLAVHFNVGDGEAYDITHIASGRSVIQFSQLVSQDAAFDLARRFAVLDYDRWWRTGKPDDFAQQVRQMFQDWAMRHYGINASDQFLIVGKAKS